MMFKSRSVYGGIKQRLFRKKGFACLQVWEISQFEKS
jgi:hypothetical protein